MNIPNAKVHFYTATRPTDQGNFCNVGTRGNFTSHRVVLELATRDGLRNVLVFEDDIGFKNIHGTIENQIIAQLNHEEWDVVFFGYLKPADAGAARTAGPLLPWPADIVGAHFYAVNGRFIGTMLQYMYECEARPPGHPDGGPMTADAAYNHVRYVIQNIRVLLSVPNLAYQRSSRTDLHPLRFFDRVPWLRSIVRSGRSIKNQLRRLRD
jgi:hypothetical protein